MESSLAASGMPKAIRQVVLLIAVSTLALSFESAAEEPRSPSDPSSPSPSGLAPKVVPASRFDLSPPLRWIKPVSAPAPRPLRVIPLYRRPAPPASAREAKAPGVPDPALQRAIGATSAPAPIVSFEGLSNSDNIAVTGGLSCRPIPTATSGRITMSSG